MLIIIRGKECIVTTVLMYSCGNILYFLTEHAQWSVITCIIIEYRLCELIAKSTTLVHLRHNSCYNLSFPSRVMQEARLPWSVFLLVLLGALQHLGQVNSQQNFTQAQVPIFRIGVFYPARSNNAADSERVI